MSAIILSVSVFIFLFALAHTFIARKNHRDAERQIRGLRKMYRRGRYATRLRRFQSSSLDSVPGAAKQRLKQESGDTTAIR